MTPRVHDFQTRYRESDEPAVAERVELILRRDLRARRVTRALEEDDRRGVDFWATLVDGHRVAVDVKRRDRSYDFGDLLLETKSRVGEGIVGWALNDHYITDFVLFLWKSRHLLVSYPQMRATLHNYLVRYSERYTVKPASSKSATASWRTENLGIPTARFLADMYGTLQWPYGTPLTHPRECAFCHHPHPAGVTCLHCPRCAEREAWAQGDAA